MAFALNALGALPLADLHRHLDGSLRRATAVELAEQARVEMPETLEFTPGMGLAAALSRFAFTTAILQRPDSVRRVADEMCVDAGNEGVTTLEIRFAPQLHRGAPMSQILDAALEGAAGRAGLILCGLYGEPPGILLELVDLARSRPGVVGIDLAGGPASGHTFRLADYAPAFRRAAEMGLGRTVHAGEGRPAAEIREAMLTLGAQRIGHGCSLLDDAGVLDLVVSRGVTLEACPTSNVHTGIYRDVAAHPVQRWLAAGVRVCVCADNTLLSQTTARQELERLVESGAVKATDVPGLIATGHAAAFHR